MLQERVPAVRDDPASGAFQAGRGDVWPVSRRRRPNTRLRSAYSSYLVRHILYNKIIYIYFIYLLRRNFAWSSLVIYNYDSYGIF